MNSICVLMFVVLPNVSGLKKQLMHSRALKHFFWSSNWKISFIFRMCLSKKVSCKTDWRVAADWTSWIFHSTQIKQISTLYLITLLLTVDIIYLLQFYMYNPLEIIVCSAIIVFLDRLDKPTQFGSELKCTGFIHLITAHSFDWHCSSQYYRPCLIFSHLLLHRCLCKQISPVDLWRGEERNFICFLPSIDTLPGSLRSSCAMTLLRSCTLSTTTCLTCLGTTTTSAYQITFVPQPL